MSEEGHLRAEVRSLHRENISQADQIRSLQGELRELQDYRWFGREEINGWRQERQRRFELVLRYSTVLFLAFSLFAVVSSPIRHFLQSAAEEQQHLARLQALSVQERELQISQIETIIVEETVQLEPSWLYGFWWNWALPISSMLLTTVLIVGIVLFLYDKYKGLMRSDSVRSYSVFSAAVSVAGMLYSLIEYNSELLEHDSSSYVMFSNLFALIFFMALFLSGSKIVAGIIYLFGVALIVLTGWFISDDPFAAVFELQTMLMSLDVPNAALMVAATIIPMLLVLIALIVLRKRQETWSGR